MKKSVKGKRIALIGGAGFIGHHLALYLKEQGADVFIIDGLSVNNLLYLHSTDLEIPGDRMLYLRMINSRLELLMEKGIPLHVEDARHYNELTHVLSKINPQVVIVLAAVSHANRSNKNPFDTFDHSIRTLENALDYARGNVEHFIYFSSSMVYGHFPPEGATEETQCNPIGIYGTLKMSGELMVKSYNNVFGLPYTIVRPSALYGERCISRRVGQIFLENAVQGKEISITGDGNDQLDFTYINDLVEGVKTIIENKNAINETFNLTFGEFRTIGEMAGLIREHFPGINIKYIAKDKLTPDRGTLLIDKARRVLGYNPQYPLEKGYCEYIKWYKSYYK
ncbi:MAG: NAD(P)-dependent oxidoreductase [Candidatus Scalindua sp.]|jgi:nucleoside-diphosphate-sugar epimerase|nr:NAD(P)-dependent oxidoreductase [Candidatus Scalindua sp.]